MHYSLFAPFDSYPISPPFHLFWHNKSYHMHSFDTNGTSFIEPLSKSGNRENKGASFFCILVRCPTKPVMREMDWKTGFPKTPMRKKISCQMIKVRFIGRSLDWVLIKFRNIIVWNILFRERQSLKKILNLRKTVRLDWSIQIEAPNQLILVASNRWRWECFAS